MTALWAWFLASRVGRYCVAALAIVVAIGAVVLKLMAMGRAQERATQTAGRLKAISKRRASDAEVDQLGAADVDSELARWMRDRR